MAPLTERWSIQESEVIDWYEWGEEFVVRVAGRAETHLLSPAAGSLLLALLESRSPLSVEALHSRVYSSQEGAPNGADLPAEERDALATVLADFERLGMASRQVA